MQQVKKELTCKHCERQFTSKTDHGKYPKFCGRSCFLGSCIQPKPKECKQCGKTFLATRSSTVSPETSEDGRRIYCSKDCFTESQKNREYFSCLNCGGQFHMTPAVARHRGKPGCCSSACQYNYYTGSNSKAYKTGTYFHTQMNEKHVRLERPGYAGKYVGEHRVVAGEAIGRLLLRHEIVIRINGLREDNSPGNLYICASIGEFRKIMHGIIPAPNRSNLADYAGGVSVVDIPDDRPK